MSAHQDARLEAASARQDARIEAIVEEGAAKIVDAALGAIAAWPWSKIIDPVARVEAVKAGRSVLLELLAAVGVDTSAHVRAPRAEVHVHRTPPHDTEGG